MLSSPFRHTKKKVRGNQANTTGDERDNEKKGMEKGGGSLERRMTMAQVPVVGGVLKRRMEKMRDQSGLEESGSGKKLVGFTKTR